MYNDLITLVVKKSISDDFGDLKDTEIKREIFAKLRSVSQTEFYQAQAIGLQPEIKFELADYYDYQNEKTLIYEDIEYSIIRTYRTGTKMELVCKKGVD